MSSHVNFDLALLSSSDAPPGPVARWFTLAGPMSGKGRWVRQTSCAGGVGIVEIWLEPYRGPSQFQLVWQVTEDQIPETFLPGIVEGIRQAALLERPGFGPLANIRVIVMGGAYHPVDSSERAYTLATLLAFEDALAKTKLVPVE